MKNIIILLALCFCTGLSAQRKVAERVAELKSLKANFTRLSVLTATDDSGDADVQRTVENATLAKINSQTVNSIVTNKYETIEVEVPYNGSIVLVSLYKVNPFNENFHIDTDKGKNIAYNKGVHYRGIVSNDLNSVASFSFFNNELQGVISGDQFGNLVVGRLDRQDNVSDYIVYSDAKLRIMNDFKCGVKDDESVPVQQPNSNLRESLSERCVTMYLEIDYNLYISNGSNTTQTTNWVTAVFNNVQTLYANDDITISLKSMYIWTTPDPYFGESSSDYLYMFNENTPVFDGDVGQLIGIDEGGLGGVAVGINGLCTQNNFSYSDVNPSYFTVPTYSWTVQVITHEFGHLLGSPHTHACVWDGGGFSIDNCAPFALGDDWEGGECMTNPPTIPYDDKGTIMSYCHLVGGVGINFNNGFGWQPQELIFNNVNTSTCLSTDCINTCINTVSQVTFTNVTPTSATITWIDLGNNTSWEVAVFPYSSLTGPYTLVTTNSFTTTTPLNPNSHYKVRIRPICTSGATPPNRQDIFATASAWCSGIVVADTGGVSNNYANNQNIIRTFIPDQPQKKIRMEFTQFELEEDFDFLTIYDGSSTAAPILGEYTGFNIPQDPIISNAFDGSLTLKFFSDPGVVEGGYAINISCEQNLAIGQFSQDIDFSYYPNPANGLVNITSKTEMTELHVYNITGQLLYHNTINSLDTQVDVSAFSTGTYFFKLKFGEKEVNFKILKN